MMETERLVLRRWHDRDREPYAALSADPAVMDWLGGKLFTREQTDAQIDSLQAELDDLGHGCLAIQRQSDGAFLGTIALAPIDLKPPAPSGVEIGWRLARHAWGHGYATEAAAAVLMDGLDRVGLAEIVSFTAHSNVRSQAVMGRIGLHRRPDLDFDHPNLAADHPLRPHVVFSTRPASYNPTP